ncbi:uncharacterized protein LOC108627999 [Ceratina calcarata]|uniref:Uncharacterized protein LOC108627999 n=1 Tax=Ceratina calcarata TaxID=156304 RepID=A0AAJ7S6R2_9HYME|nr:uncharacterized protein LOC108627999 [Ceratina calcarata]
MSSSQWDQMLQVAKMQQQEYYELLPEWTKYEKDEYTYLKQNIGFALFGPPSESTESTESNVLLNADTVIENDNIINAFHYKEEAQTVIDTVYDKVVEFGDGALEESYIYYGLIFNVAIYPPIPNLDEKKDISKDGKIKAIDQGTKKEVPESENVEVNMCSAPIFKILRSKDGVWYIDTHGRVYKSWMDYKENNTLPKCTMVLPMNGCYKADCSCAVTEDSSTVWLEILDSPACSTTSTVLQVTDTGTSVIGMIGLGLTVASIFTPAAPVAIGALAATGVSGVWATGRAVHNLVDRSTHEESINITNRSAFCSWLTITGGALGLAAAGGNAVLNKIVQSGNVVGKGPQVVHDVLLLSNLGVNGFGLGYQVYSMYQHYQEGGEIRVIDVLSLTTHVLFFGNAVMNMKFAGDLIESTQGKIVDDFRNDIRGKNLRKQFNRVKRNAAANNVDKMGENAEVIRYINNKYELRLANGISPSNNALNNNIILFDNGVIKVCGYSLLDPLKFVSWLIKLDLHRRTYSSAPLTSRDDGEAGGMASKLKDLLLTLLSNFSQNHRNISLPNIDEFDSTFEDMKYMKNGIVVFNLIFKIATALIEHKVEFKEYIVKAVHFIWCYVKESVRTNGLTVIFSIDNEEIQRALQKILQNILDHLDAVEERLMPAFETYVHKYLETFFS